MLAVSVGVAFATNPPWPSEWDGLGCTDDRDFNFTSTESNTGDYYDYLGTMIAGMDIWGDGTDLVVRNKWRTYHDWIDIYW